MKRRPFQASQRPPAMRSIPSRTRRTPRPMGSSIAAPATRRHAPAQHERHRRVASHRRSGTSQRCARRRSRCCRSERLRRSRSARPRPCRSGGSIRRSPMPPSRSSAPRSSLRLRQVGRRPHGTCGRDAHPGRIAARRRRLTAADRPGSRGCRPRAWCRLTNSPEVPNVASSVPLGLSLAATRDATGGRRPPSERDDRARASDADHRRASLERAEHGQATVAERSRPARPPR